MGHYLTLTTTVFKVRFSPSKNIYFIYFNESPSRMMKSAFYFTLKAFFCLDYVVVEEKIYDVTTWLTNNCNTYIVQYLTK